MGVGSDQRSNAEPGLSEEGETIIIRFCGILMQATIRISLSALGCFVEYATMKRKQKFNDGESQNL